MKTETLSIKSICANRDSVNNYFAWPTVARLKDGRLAMTASGFRVTHMCPFGKSVICYSSDEGKNWTLPAVVIDSPLDDRDTGITPFGESSVLVCNFNDGVEWYRNRIESGVAEKPEMIAYTKGYLDFMESKKDWRKYEGTIFRISHDNSLSFGEYMHMPITNPHGPAVLPDNNLLWVGNAYRPEHDVTDNLLHCYKVFQDGSYEFMSEIKTTDIGGYCEPYAIVLSSGKVIVHIRIEDYKKGLFTIYQSESLDGGKSFTIPHSIGLQDDSGAPAHIIEHNGVLISVYSHREKRNNSIRAMFSYDEGETWCVDHIIAELSDVDCDLGYPASVALEDGSILTVFYSGDEDYSETTRYASDDGKYYEYTVPVIRQVIWRYQKD